MVSTEDASVFVCGEMVRPLITMKSVDLCVVRVRQYLSEDISCLLLSRLFLSHLCRTYVIRISIPDTFGLDAMPCWARRYFCRAKVGSTNPLGVSSLPVVSNLNLHLIPQQGRPISYISTCSWRQITTVNL
jgi:hypothetical protein